MARSAPPTSPTRGCWRRCWIVPRERFFPEDKASLAYLDLDVAVNEPGTPLRRLLKPMVLAKLISIADVRQTDHVLDVGCATGYSTALLARLGRLRRRGSRRTRHWRAVRPWRWPRPAPPTPRS